MKQKLFVWTVLIALAAGLSGCVSMRTATAWRESRARELAAGSTIADTASGPIEYAEFGSGPAVLALHGAMGGYDAGIAVGRALAPQGVRFISVSRPGYLRTPISVGRTPAEEADAYVSLLDSLGIHRVAVIAASGGGPAALEFAIRHPDRCWGFILISAIIEQKGLDNFTPAERAWFRRSMGDRQSYRTVQMIEKNPQKAIAVMAPETAKRLAGNAEAMKVAVALAMTNFPMSIRSVGTLNDVEGKHPIHKSELESIRVPTLILHGSDDKWAPVATARMAADAIPNAQIRVYKGDHLFFIAYMDSVKKRLADFVKANEP